jgi:hypothetical protein
MMIFAFRAEGNAAAADVSRDRALWQDAAAPGVLYIIPVIGHYLGAESRGGAAMLPLHPDVWF